MERSYRPRVLGDSSTTPSFKAGSPSGTFLDNRATALIALVSETCCLVEEDEQKMVSARFGRAGWTPSSWAGSASADILDTLC